MAPSTRGRIAVARARADHPRGPRRREAPGAGAGAGGALRGVLQLSRESSSRAGQQVAAESEGVEIDLSSDSHSPGRPKRKPTGGSESEELAGRICFLLLFPVRFCSFVSIITHKNEESESDRSKRTHVSWFVVFLGGFLNISFRVRNCMQLHSFLNPNKKWNE